MKIEFDPAGIAAVLNEPKAVAFQRERATEAVEDAKRTARRDPRHRTHIADKIRVGETRPTDDGAVTAIEWNSPFWHFVEWPDRPLMRGAQNAGLRVIEHG